MIVCNLICNCQNIVTVRQSRLGISVVFKICYIANLARFSFCIKHTKTDILRGYQICHIG